MASRPIEGDGWSSNIFLFKRQSFQFERLVMHLEITQEYLTVSNDPFKTRYPLPSSFSRQK
jgi:hypothetical protein